MSFDIRIGLAFLAALAVGWAIWGIASRPQPLTWRGREPWTKRAVASAGQGARKRLGTEVSWQADILQIPSRDLIGMAIGLAIGAGIAMLILGMVMPPMRIMAIPIAVAAFFIGPSMIVRRRFRAYQQAMQLAFETHVLLLRIYFDLGQSVLTALRTMRQALNGVPLKELDRLLSDLAEGRGDTAFRDWASRTRLDEYKLLADTIVQQRGRALRGEALDPLDTILTANRQQSMKVLTDRLTGGGALVPILATVAVTTLYLYALFSRIHGIGALDFHL